MLLDISTAYESERLLLRSYQTGDGAAYYAMMQINREHLADEMMPSELNVDAESAEVHVRQLAADWASRSKFVVCLWEKATSSFIGEVYIGAVDWNVPEFEIGYFIIKEREGQGLITEAVKASLRFVFEQLQAHKVMIRCKDTNLKSARVAERCGFVKEGHLRETKRTQNGGFRGLLYFGLLRSEYGALNGK
jgi:RimJ/RimL family protein N-acetyltransferase